MAAATQDLDLFVRDALAHGQSRDAIAAALDAAGWPAAQVRSALDAYAPVAFPIPVPKPRPQVSAREAFLYLVLFATLYLAAWHLGSLAFDLINHAFPDPSDDRPSGLWGGDATRWSIASIVVAFPVFLFVARQLGRELAANPVKRLSAVRRWLTYLTMFIAVTVLSGDFIMLVYKGLGGELTIRFGLKVLVAALISGAVLGYYLGDLRHEERETPAAMPPPASRLGRWLAIVAGVVMVLAIVAAIAVTGTPSERRRVKMDNRRTVDLQHLEEAVDEAYEERGVLPPSLAELARKPGNTLSLVDPETSVPYAYLPASGRRYELCAVFATDTGVTDAQDATRWQHGVGRHCFDLEAPKPD
jgi:type II secretory pathway pseudopilin PulG